MAYTVTVDTDECLSSGKCVADYPEGFDFDDDDLAVVAPGVSSLSDDQLLRAARNCPARAIHLFDVEGNEIAT
jgi:ferredoxin